jgi:hypothetical protein
MVGVHLELPFHGSAQALTMSKRFDFDGLGIDDVEDTKFKVKTVNETPLDAYVQVYFTDGLGNVLDSLFSSTAVLKGAPVDADGFTTGAEEVTTIIDLTQDKADRIDQASYMLITTVIFTTNNGTVPVKFAPDDQVKVNIGLSTRFGYKIN